MSEPTTTGGTEYHWIITIQLGSDIVTNDGVHTVTAPTTRVELFKQIVAGMRTQLGVTKLAVLYFDLSPNAITPGGVL